MCKRVLKSQTLTEGEIPFFKISTFGGSADTFITKELYQNYKQSYSYPKKGDILISAAGTLGKTIIYDGRPAYFQDSNIVWIDNDEQLILNSYLYYFYQTKPWLTTKGSTINRIYNENLRALKIYHPEIPKQQAISDVLLSIDNKIELNNRINAELEEMAKTLYDYWFVQFDFPFDFAQNKPAANGKPYKSSGGKMIYNPTLKREIPEGWGVKKIGEVAMAKAGSDKPHIFSIEKTETCPIPIYSNGISNDGLYGFTNEATVTNQSVTISARGTIGYSILRNTPFVPIIRLIVITPHASGSANYFYEYLRTIEFEKSGSVQQQLTVPQVSDINILYPPIDVLKKFETLTSSGIEKIENIKEQNLTLTKLRDWLLPMLMNGQVTVK